MTDDVLMGGLLNHQDLGRTASIPEALPEPSPRDPPPKMNALVRGGVQRLQGADSLCRLLIESWG
jgi:hypothetical protein